MDSINTLCLTGHLVGSPSWETINKTRYLRWLVEVDDPSHRAFQVPVFVDSPALGRVLARMKPGSRVVVVGRLDVRSFGEHGGPAVRLYARLLKPYDDAPPQVKRQAAAGT